jgi:hypothetical protein
LNAKSLFDPSLKKGKPIVIDDDIPEDIPVETGKGATTRKTLKDMPMRKTIGVGSKRQRVTSAVQIPKQDDEVEKKHSIIPLMSELPNLSIDKPLSSSPIPAEENINDEPFLDVDILKMRPTVTGYTSISINQLQKKIHVEKMLKQVKHQKGRNLEIRRGSLSISRSIINNSKNRIPSYIRE